MMPQPPSPETTESAEPDPLRADEGALAQTPAGESAPASPSMIENPPSQQSSAQLVETEPDNPRALCGPRTHFALYRCMKAVCDRAKYFDHPECTYLRAMDDVRPVP